MAEENIARKLQIKPGSVVAVVNPPDGYLPRLDPLPPGARLAKPKDEGLDVLQIFATSKAELDKNGPAALNRLKPDGILWVCYPKGTSRIKTDLNRDCGWDVLKARGLEGVSLVSVDDTWSAMRFRPAEKVKSRSEARRMSPSAPGLGTSDEATRAATGKGWDEWFEILDQAGALGMDHKEIVAHLASNYSLSGWWQQQVTVEYEQRRKGRPKHLKDGAYEISRSKTIGVSLGSVYRAFTDDELRSTWLPDLEWTITTATENKSLRIKVADSTRVSVEFFAKGEAKSQVTVQHGKLPDPERGEAMKTYWEEALNRLKEVLE